MMAVIHSLAAIMQRDHPFSEFLKHLLPVPLFTLTFEACNWALQLDGVSLNPATATLLSV